MVFHVITPQSFLSRKLLVNMFDGFRQKCSRTRGRVKNLYFMDFLFGFKVLFGLAVIILWLNFHRSFRSIGKSLGQIKFCFQDFIHRPNNEIHYGLWRVPNPTSFAECRVLFTQEVFVKVNDRVFHALRFAVVFQDFRHIASQENIYQIVHNPQ